MPITKDGSGKIVETAIDSADQFLKTGVIRATEHAICDHTDRLKQVAFDPSSQTSNTTVTLKSGANSSNITLTLPATSGTLSTGGGGTSFATMQTPAGTSPVATGATDTLTFTSSDSTVTITGNSSTDTIDFKAAASTTIGSLDAQAENANGLAFVSGVLSTQSADATHPGMVNNTTQTFSGAKTFNAGVGMGVAPGASALRVKNSAGTDAGGLVLVSDTNVVWNLAVATNYFALEDPTGNPWVTSRGGDTSFGPDFPKYHWDFFVGDTASDPSVIVPSSLTNNWPMITVRNTNATAGNFTGVTLTGSSRNPMGGMYSINSTQTSGSEVSYLSFYNQAAGVYGEKLRITSAGMLAVQTLGQGLAIKEGSNAKMGTAVLVGGTVVVSTTAVTSTSRIFLTTQVPGGTIGAQYVSARTAGTSFTITSLSAIDTSTVAWMLVEPS